jgi:hypothetical protein
MKRIRAAKKKKRSAAKRKSVSLAFITTGRSRRRTSTGRTFSDDTPVQDRATDYPGPKARAKR